MFGFESIEAYKRAHKLSLLIRSYILANKIDRVTEDQLRRAVLSIPLNRAEGARRSSS